MKLIACLYSLLVYSSLLKSQVVNEFMSSQISKQNVGAIINYEVGSSGFSNAFINKFIFGGNIDSKFKQDNASKINTNNNFGYNYQYGMHALIGKNDKYSYLISVNQYNFINAVYIKDAYDLILNGNQPYVDKLKVLSGTKFTQLQFQAYKFGILCHNVDSSANIGVSVALLNGQNSMNFELKKHTSIYTNINASEIQLTANGQLNYISQAKQNLLEFNGVGGSIDLYFEGHYKTKKKHYKNSLIISVTNLGFINWINNTKNISVDTTVYFRGYTIKSTLDLTDSALAKINGDTVLKKITKSNKNNFYTTLPVNVLVMHKFNWFKNVVFYAGGRYMFHSNYNLYVFAESEFKINNQLSISTQIGYGGFSYGNINIGCSYNSQKWYAKICSSNLQSLLLPDYTYYQNVFMQLGYKF